MLADRLTEVFRFWRFGLLSLLLVVLPFTFIGLGIQIALGAPLQVEEDVLLINWPTLALLALLYPIASGALIAQLAAIQQGQAASLSQCVAASLRYATLLLFTYALLGSAVYIGLIALVLPGIWLYARLSQGPFIVMLEQQNPIEALRLSFARTEKYQWQILLGIMVLAGVVLFVTLLSASLSQVVAGESPLGDVIHLLITAPVGILIDILIFRFYSLQNTNA